MVAGAPNQIADFVLADQHGQVRTYRFPKARVTVMAIADSKGSAQLEPWISKIYQRFGTAVDIDGIADVSRVPAALQSTVRIVFRNQLARSIMLDWDGSVVKQFGYKRGNANLYLLNEQGHVVDQLSGPIEQSKLDQLSRALQAELSDS